MKRRRLDVELVRRRLVGSRGEARRAIEAGLVRVGSNADPKPATLVSADDPVDLVAAPDPFVSRAGRKLDVALDTWELDVGGLRAIDVGASTGGFTDCLLQRGIEGVVAVDVGYGQLHWRIRQDPRVTVIERTNIRTADPAELGAPFDVIVADLSFISLSSLASVFATLGGDAAVWVVLIKPQFEAGRELVGRGGIVKDIAARESAIRSVVESFEQAGLGCQRLAVSSVRGATGNVEFVAEFTRAPRAIDAEDIASTASEEPT